MSRDQPSIITNKKSLSGSDIVTGETIIIPIAIRMLEITRSITTKGKNNKNPISKAAVSSVTTNAGITISKSVSVASSEISAGHNFFAVLKKNCLCSGLLLGLS